MDPTAHPDMVQKRKSLPFARIRRLILYLVDHCPIFSLVIIPTKQQNHQKFQFCNKPTRLVQEHVTSHLQYLCQRFANTMDNSSFATKPKHERS